MNQITKLHRAEASNYRWRDKFFEGSKAVRLTNASCNRNTRSTLILKRHARFVDGSGNLYFADYPGARVYKVSPDGVMTAYAGTGVAGTTGEGGPAIAARLNAPFSLALDSAGNLYISQLDHRVRRVSPDGMIDTVAGTGIARR